MVEVTVDAVCVKFTVAHIDDVVDVEDVVVNVIILVLVEVAMVICELVVAVAA